MLWMFFSLLSAPSISHSENNLPKIKVPEEMQAKWNEFSTSVVSGYENARARVDEAGREEMGQKLKKKVREARESSFADSVFAAAGRVWIVTKQKARGLVVKLDQKFHEKILGPDSGEDGPTR